MTPKFLWTNLRYAILIIAVIAAIITPTPGCDDKCSYSWRRWWGYILSGIAVAALVVRNKNKAKHGGNRNLGARSMKHTKSYRGSRPGVFRVAERGGIRSSQPSSAGNPAAGAASPQAGSLPAAPTAETNAGGFDGARAYKHVAQLVAIGPHSAGTEANHRAQSYIIEQLKSFGCPVEEQDFHANSTPVGDVAMKNIVVVKIPSSNPNIILYASHYDTKRIDNFVGADDGGSSTGVLLELARLLCARKNAETIWLAFLDGEEAFNLEWADPDNTYGSRQLAASLALSGDLRRVKAMILVDMVGPAHAILKREENSTPRLAELNWSNAARLG